MQVPGYSKPGVALGHYAHARIIVTAFCRQVLAPVHPLPTAKARNSNPWSCAVMKTGIKRLVICSCCIAKEAMPSVCICIAKPHAKNTCQSHMPKTHAKAKCHGQVPTPVLAVHSLLGCRKAVVRERERARLGSLGVPVSSDRLEAAQYEGTLAQPQGPGAAQRPSLTRPQNYLEVSMARCDFPKTSCMP